MKKLAIALGILCSGLTGIAQNELDVIRYTQPNFQTNARSMAVGGAYGALGGNVISTSINPAGIAFFPTSEFTISTGILTANTQSTYIGNQYGEDKYALTLPNIGLAFTEFETDFGKPVKDGWVNHSFAMTMNRTHSFGGNLLFQGNNTRNGMIDFFAEDATSTWNAGYNLDSFTYGGLAFFGYLIDPVFDEDSNTVGFTPSVMDVDDINYDQRQSLATRGNITDINFAWAGNYSNKFYVGFNLGIPILNYREEGTFEETNNYAGDDNYNYMRMKHTLSDNGVGVNASLGLIYKPVHFLRVGLAAKTPTFFSIQRSFETSLTTDTDARSVELAPGESEYNYRLVTPYTFTGSLGLIIMKQGFISVDYMVTDPSTARLRGSGQDGSLEYFNENQYIGNALQATNQLRLGGEWKFGQFALRGGYSVSSSALKPEMAASDNLFELETYSGGIGYREKNFYLDLGYQLATSKDIFQPYGLATEQVPTATNTKRMSTLMASVGFTF